MSGFSVKGASVDIQGVTAAIDTGTSLVAVPIEDAKKVNSLIGASPGMNGQYSVDCSTVGRLPDVSFKFGEREFTLTSKDYIIKIQSTCLSGFAGIDIPKLNKLWIVGDVFLRKYYSIYDLENNRVGLANAK
jgi:saccharopepsin